MKWRLAAVALLILAGIFLWRGNHVRFHRADAVDGKQQSAEMEVTGPSTENLPMRTKASFREKTLQVATHSPARLKDFILPDLTIAGDLRTALRLVDAAYRETCAKTGETRLPLKFDLPPGTDATIRVHLSGKSLGSSVKLLAALAGMQVTRDELTYRFEPLAGKASEGKSKLPVPPDFASRLAEMAGVTAPQDLRQTLAALGLDLDPATTMEISPSGNLTVETDRPADAAAINALVQALGSERPTQMKVVTKSCDLPAGNTWSPPAVLEMTDERVTEMMADLSRQTGSQFETFPSVTMRNKQAATIEIVRDLTWEDRPGDWQKQNVGVVLAVKSDALGFGQDFDFHFNDTSGDLDPATGKPAITTNADIADTAFISNGGTILRVEKRPDGSRRLLLVNSVRIDATGRPIE